MRPARAARPPLRRGAAVTALLMAAAGCGEATSPAEAVPELDTALGRVDRALAGGDLVIAQRRLDRLVRITVTARRSGDLESAESDAILAAAASLAAQLPRGGRLPQPDEPSDSGGDAKGPAEEPAPEDGGGLDPEEAEERAEEREELHERREELQKELEKQEEEQDEDEESEGKGEGEGKGQGKGEGNGNGGGNRGGNGADDGHGN